MLPLADGPPGGQPPERRFRDICRNRPRQFPPLARSMRSIARSSVRWAGASV